MKSANGMLFKLFYRVTANQSLMTYTFTDRPQLINPSVWTPGEIIEASKTNPIYNIKYTRMFCCLSILCCNLSRFPLVIVLLQCRACLVPKLDKYNLNLCMCKLLQVCHWEITCRCHELIGAGNIVSDSKFTKHTL